jgi:hypothetical protein
VCKSGTSVQLGKFPVEPRTLFYMRCNFKRCLPLIFSRETWLSPASYSRFFRLHYFDFSCHVTICIRCFWGSLCPNLNDKSGSTCSVALHIARPLDKFEMTFQIQTKVQVSVRRLGERWTHKENYCNAKNALSLMSASPLNFYLKVAVNSFLGKCSGIPTFFPAAVSWYEIVLF